MINLFVGLFGLIVAAALIIMELVIRLGLFVIISVVLIYLITLIF
jgi:hypothetical protein